MENSLTISTELELATRRDIRQAAGWDIAVGVLLIILGIVAIALEETLDSIIDPESIIVRFFSAEFGSPNPITGERENWLDILKEAEKLVFCGEPLSFWLAMRLANGLAPWDCTQPEIDELRRSPAPSFIGLHWAKHAIEKVARMP